MSRPHCVTASPALPRLTFHAGTRHTCATLMLSADTHVRVAAERLGHADPGITLRVYFHVTQTLNARPPGEVKRPDRSISFAKRLSRPRVSNPEPVVYKTTALPIELGRRDFPNDFAPY